MCTSGFLNAAPVQNHLGGAGEWFGMGNPTRGALHPDGANSQRTGKHWQWLWMFYGVHKVKVIFSCFCERPMKQISLTSLPVLAILVGDILWLVLRCHLDWLHSIVFLDIEWTTFAGLMLAHTHIASYTLILFSYKSNQRDVIPHICYHSHDDRLVLNLIPCCICMSPLFELICLDPTHWHHTHDFMLASPELMLRWRYPKSLYLTLSPLNSLHKSFDLGLIFRFFLTYEHSRLAKKVKNWKRPTRMKSAEGRGFTCPKDFSKTLTRNIVTQRSTKVIKHCPCTVKLASLKRHSFRSGQTLSPACYFSINIRYQFQVIWTKPQALQAFPQKVGAGGLGEAPKFGALK